jgi:hypothetical protein
VPFYRVRLMGRNIVREVDGKRELLNFVTTRVIEAATAEHASETALELIYNTPELKEPLNNDEDPFPIVLVEEVEEIGTLPSYRPPGE